MGSLWEGAVGLVVRKTISLLIVLLLVLTVEFLFFRVGVGEDGYAAKRPEVQPYEAEKLHFNEFLLVQYFYFIGDMLTGKGSFDLFSRIGMRPVADKIDDSFPRTLMLFGAALVFSLLLGLLAAYALWRMKSRVGKTIGATSLLILWAVPVVFYAVLFLLQVVWRFSLDWAMHPPFDYGSMGWAERLLYDVKQRTFPIIILTICSFGGFSLIAWQGMRRANLVSRKDIQNGNPKGPSFSELIVSVMPNLKLNIAFIMSCVLFVEVFWTIDGLGYQVLAGIVNLDMAIVDASLFLILLIVLVSGFILDLSFSLLALRSSRTARGAPQIVVQETSPEPTLGRAHTPPFGNLIGELRWFGSEYKRSIPGLVGGILLVAMAVLAVVGPMIGEPYVRDYSQPNDEPNPVSQFLIGARDPFLQTLGVLVLSMVIGFVVATLTLPLGKFNYPVVLIAECFLVFPIVVVVYMVGLLRTNFEHPVLILVLSTVLVTWAPVALVVLRRTHEINDSYSAKFPTEAGIARFRGIVRDGLMSALPEAVAALKYVAVVGTLSIVVVESSIFGAMNEATWGSMMDHALQFMKFFDFDLWWMLPLIGVVVMVSGFYLVLQASQDILEKRIRPAGPAPSPPQSGP